MQTRFSSIIDSEKMDLEELLNIARQELAVATATSSHVNIPDELVSSLQELISRLGQTMPSAEASANPSDTETVTLNDSPSSQWMFSIPSPF